MFILPLLLVLSVVTMVPSIEEQVLVLLVVILQIPLKIVASVALLVSVKETLVSVVLILMGSEFR